MSKVNFIIIIIVTTNYLTIKSQIPFWQDSISDPLKLKLHQKKEARYRMLTKYIESDYLYLIAGGGIGMNVAYKVNITNGNLPNGPSTTEATINLIGGLGFKFAFKHKIGLDANLLSWSTNYSLKSPISGKEYSSTLGGVVYPNFSLYYLYDLIPDNIRFKLYVGGNIGLGFTSESSGGHSYYSYMSDIDTSLGKIYYEYNKPSKVVFNFGPQLWFEWNFSRFASLNLRHIWYIQPHYMYYEKIRYEFTGEPPINVERKIGYLNFSMLNINLKIRMIIFQKLNKK